MRLNRRDFLKALGVVLGGFVVWGRSLLRAQSQPLVINQASGRSGIAGTVTEIVTGQPLAGATVSASGLTSTVTTDAMGQFDLELPPGIYEILVTAPGFLDMSRVHQEVGPSSLLVADFAMVPLNPSEEEAQIIYERLIASPQGSLEQAFLAPGQQTPQGIAPTVTVPSTIVVEWPDGTQQTLDLDYYLKGVVPFEMPPDWPLEALKAQAVAARTYAVAYTQGGTKPICTTTSCQVYGDKRYASTNLAVDATSGQVATYQDNIISAVYFSRCNGKTTRDSEHAMGSDDNGKWLVCSEHPWNYSPYLRARSCNGHQPYSSSCGYYGHGVGMCQWGAYYWAEKPYEWDYLRILNWYYTGITVTKSPPAPISPFSGALFQVGSNITLMWSAGWANYLGELQNLDTGATIQYGWTPSTSWPLGAWALGRYQWHIKGRDVNGVETPFSTYSRFYVVQHVYNTYFPRTDKNSTSNW